MGDAVKGERASDGSEAGEHRRGGCGRDSRRDGWLHSPDHAHTGAAVRDGVGWPVACRPLRSPLIPRGGPAGVQARECRPALRGHRGSRARHRRSVTRHFNPGTGILLPRRLPGRAHDPRRHGRHLRTRPRRGAGEGQCNPEPRLWDFHHRAGSADGRAVPLRARARRRGCVPQGRDQIHGCNHIELSIRGGAARRRVPPRPPCPRAQRGAPRGGTVLVPRQARRARRKETLAGPPRTTVGP
mmetsp:Transcript_288/g.698  ORF Transcript_288/g.698 Transcript_288/m.698 type:complete len:242 (+) Transcript_288:98-823(+)